MNYSWAERVRWCRTHLTMREIAEYCGVALPTMYDIGNGRIKQPGGYAAVRLYLLSEQYPPPVRHRRGNGANSKRLRI